MTALRVVIALIGFVAAIFWTWWIPAICILLLSLRFRAWEAVVLGVFMDMLWLSPDTGFHGLPLFTIYAIAIVWILEPIRSEFLA